jgi:hypothetical protein
MVSTYVDGWEGQTDSIRLRDYPGDVVRFSCGKCGRQGQYRRGKLMAIHGADIPLPDLLVQIARCDRRGQMHDMCGVHYLGLTPSG